MREYSCVSARNTNLERQNEMIVETLCRQSNVVRFFFCSFFFSQKDHDHDLEIESTLFPSKWWMTKWNKEMKSEYVFRIIWKFYSFLQKYWKILKYNVLKMYNIFDSINYKKGCCFVLILLFFILRVMTY